LRARRPNNRSTFESQLLPARGQQNAPAPAIKVIPVSTINNEGPPEAAEATMT
jgi:hypothetical protein